MAEQRGSSEFSFKLKMVWLVFIYFLALIHIGNAVTDKEKNMIKELKEKENRICEAYKNDPKYAETMIKARITAISKTEILKVFDPFKKKEMPVEYGAGQLCDSQGPVGTDAKTEKWWKEHIGLCEYEFNEEEINKIANKTLGRRCFSHKCYFHHKTNQFICRSTSIQAMAIFVASLTIFGLGLGQVLS